MNHYIHSVPGRLRIKIPTIKGQPGNLQSIKNLIEDLQAVDDIKADEITMRSHPLQARGYRLVSGYRFFPIMLTRQKSS